jgi:hypothetical protein
VLFACIFFFLGGFADTAHLLSLRTTHSHSPLARGSHSRTGQILVKGIRKASTSALNS